MDKETVIKILEEEKTYMQQHAGKAQVEAFDMAVSAVNKQISIKPQKVLAFTGKTVFECMNCGNELEVNSFNGQYCHWCGQKLDWSDTD